MIYFCCCSVVAMDVLIEGLSLRRRSLGAGARGRQVAVDNERQQPDIGPAAATAAVAKVDDLAAAAAAMTARLRRPHLLPVPSVPVPVTVSSGGVTVGRGVTVGGRVIVGGARRHG